MAGQMSGTRACSEMRGNSYYLRTPIHALLSGKLGVLSAVWSFSYSLGSKGLKVPRQKDGMDPMAMGNPMGGGMYPSYTGTWGFKGKGRGKGGSAAASWATPLRQVETGGRRPAAADPHGTAAGAATGPFRDHRRAEMRAAAV